MKKKLWKGMVPLVLVAASFLILKVTKENPAVAEYVFARGIYKYYAIAWSSVTQLLPFSLMEFGIVLAPFALVLLLIFLMRNRKKWKTCLVMLCHVAAGIFFLLTCMCNVNYNRYSFVQISGLTLQESSVEELNRLCLMLARQANTYREELSCEDEAGAMKLEELSVKKLSKTARAAYEKLNDIYGVFDYSCAASKPIFFSRLMSYTDLVGVYCPLTMETNINMDVAHYSIPSTICHELAHFYGFMREDEANFIGYLVCMEADSVEFKYSGTMLALIHAGNKLAEADMDAYRALWETYSEGVETDLKQNSAYWQQFQESVVKEVSTNINDVYLKANNQEDGVRSYGRMVDLLLAYYRE